MWIVDKDVPNKVSFEFNKYYTITVEITKGGMQLRTFFKDGEDIKLVFTRALSGTQIGL